MIESLLLLALLIPVTVTSNLTVATACAIAAGTIGFIGRLPDLITIAWARSRRNASATPSGHTPYTISSGVVRDENGKAVRAFPAINIEASLPALISD